MNEYTATSNLESGDPGDDGRAFRRALGQYATGVTIVTASNGMRHVGVTANSFSSVSLEPPLILWSIDRKSSSLDTFLEATHFAVNVLEQEQTELCAKFSRTSEEKFLGVDWKHGIGGVPLLQGAILQLQCKREVEYDGGDHLIMVGRVEHYTRHHGEPLLFSGGRYMRAVDRPVTETGSTTTAGGEESDATLLQVLLAAYEGLSAKFQTHRESEGLNLNQSRALAVLARGASDTADRIARIGFLGQSAAEDALTNLVSRGFAKLKDNGRFEVTSAGREVSARLRRQLRAVEAQAVASVPNFDLAGIHKLVAAIAKEVRE